MVMFSGLVCVGMLTALGRSPFTVLVITGIVIRKMMRSTSITSTSGVVLMVAIMPPLLDSPTFIDMVSYSLKSAPGRHVVPRRCGCIPRGGRLAAAYSANARRGFGRGGTRTTSAGAALDLDAAYQVGMQVAGEVPQRILQHLVAAEEPVVAPHRRHRHEQAERRHDERLADRACHLVDARLAGDADADQRVQDAPHRAEQSDERRRRA